MFATPLERAVRRQVRARLHSSDVLWREYLPRRRIERWGMARRIGGASLFTLGLLTMAAMFAVMQVGLGILATQGPNAGKHNGPFLPLAFNAMLLTGASLARISDLRKALTRSNLLATCAYFPVADRDFRRQCISAWAGLAASFIFTPAVFSWLAHGRELQKERPEVEVTY